MNIDKEVSSIEEADIEELKNALLEFVSTAMVEELKATKAIVKAVKAAKATKTAARAAARVEELKTEIETIRKIVSDTRVEELKTEIETAATTAIEARKQASIATSVAVEAIEAADVEELKAALLAFVSNALVVAKLEATIEEAEEEKDEAYVKRWRKKSRYCLTTMSDFYFADVKKTLLKKFEPN